MSELNDPSEHDLTGEIDALRARLSEIADVESGDEQNLPGLADVLRGLDSMLEHIGAQELDGRATTQVSLLTHGLGAVADFLQESSAYELEEIEPEPPKKMDGLQQFISAFQKEARKRLSGLSLSMMSIFHEDAADSSLESSAQHLHAIRGGAAMLNLKEVAELSGLMEQLIVAMGRLPAAERDWPTQALLRGYQLLKTAAEDPNVYVDEEAAEHVCSDLQATFDELTIQTATPAAQVIKKAKEKPAPEPEAEAEDSPPEALEDPFAERHIEESVTTLDESLEQRILVVDDVEMIAASVGFVLSELDLPLDIAANGEEALTMMRESPYSLVVSDIAMPRLDGIALTRMMRDDESLRDIPVILLTSLDHPSERDAGIEAGANDYIIKGSIGGGELTNRVRELLKIAPFVPAIRERGPRKRVLVAEDTETVAASIAFVLSEAEIDIVLAPNGAEALAKLQRESFDLLISDWQMPSMTGIELIEAVRSNEAMGDLPIILLTSLDSDSVRDRGLSAGANRFLVKGQVGGGALLELVEELIA